MLYFVVNHLIKTLNNIIKTNNNNKKFIKYSIFMRQNYCGNIRFLNIKFNLV